MKKVKLLKSKYIRGGFTLIEAVITLSIVCSLILVTSFEVKNFQAKFAEQQTMQQFKNTFKSTLNKSFLSKRDYYVVISKNSSSILFKSSDDKTYLKRIKLPKTLKYSKTESIIQIRKTSFVRPQTIKFHSSLTNQDYIYVIQMNWGEIIEKKA